MADRDTGGRPDTGAGPGAGTGTDALDSVAFDAFALAIRVMYRVHGIEEPGPAYEKPWALLREIADGRTTLASPAELAAKYPAMRELLFDTANRIVHHDRELATAILRGLSRGL